MRTLLEPPTDLNDPVDFFVSGRFFGDLFLEGGEFLGGNDGSGVATALDLALIGVLEGGADGDDPVGARHL